MKTRPFLLLRVQRPTKEMVLAQGAPFAQEPDEKATVGADQMREPLTAARPWASVVHVPHGLRGHLVHEGFHAGVPAAGQTPPR